MKTKEPSQKKGTPAWRERLRLPAAGRRGPVPGTVRRVRLTEEEKAERKRAANARQAEKVRERKLANMVALGLEVKPLRTPLEGRVFGKLTVRCYRDTVGGKGRRKARWTVDCACGREVVLRSDQLLAKYGRKHCGCGRGHDFGETVPWAGDVKKRGGTGRLGTPDWVRKNRREAAVREYTPAELAERELQAAEKEERKRHRALNATRARMGLDYVKPEPKAMDAAGWIRLLATMRRSGARWADLTMELESAAAFGVTREMVEAER